MSTVMTPALFIRTKVFAFKTQREFADLVGVTQVTVSRWEDGRGRIPGPQQIKIRRMAIEGGKPWNDSWFFEVPQSAEAA